MSNNAAYWAPLEEVWANRLDGTVHAVLEYRKPIDLGEQVEIVQNGPLAALVVAGELRSVARLDPDGAADAEHLART